MALSSLLQFSEFAGIRTCTALLSFRLEGFSFSHSVGDGLTFDSRNVWYTEEFIIDSTATRYPGSVKAKQV